MQPQNYTDLYDKLFFQATQRRATRPGATRPGATRPGATRRRATRPTLTRIDVGRQMEPSDGETLQSCAYWRILDTFQRSDQLRGISSSFYRSAGEEGELYYSRDASGTVKPDDEQCEKLSYLAVGISYAIACMDLVQAYSMKEAASTDDADQNDDFITQKLEQIQNLLNHYCRVAENHRNPEKLFIGFVQHTLAPMLCGVSLPPNDYNIVDNVDDAIKMLEDTQKYASMSIEAYHLVTKTRHNPKAQDGSPIAVVQHDQPLTRLSDVLHREYNLAVGDIPAEQPLWYTQMKPAAQAVFKYVHFTNIMKNNRVLSSQLRAIGPIGPKNPYRCITTVFDETSQRVLMHSSFLRHGAHATLTPGVGEDEEVRTAQLSMRQLREQLSVDAEANHFHLDLLLNSSTVDSILKWCCCRNKNTLFDGRIVTSATEAARTLNTRVVQRLPADDSSDGADTPGAATLLAPQPADDDADDLDPTAHEAAVLVAKVPVNASRRIEGLGITPEIIQQVNESIDGAFDFLHRVSCSTVDGLDEMRPEVCRLGEHLEKIQRDFTTRLTRCPLIRDKNVNAAYVISALVDMSATIDAIRSLGKQNQSIQDDPALKGLCDALKIFTVWFGCASGENRTGLVMLVCQMQGVLNSCDLIDEWRAQEILISNGHIPLAMGMGTTLVGIRPKSSGSLPKNTQGCEKGIDYNPVPKVADMFTRIANMKNVSSIINKARQPSCCQRLCNFLTCCGMFTPPEPEFYDRQKMESILWPDESLLQVSVSTV